MTTDILDRIERTIDTLRPYIASHRGSVEVIDFDAADRLGPGRPIAGGLGPDAPEWGRAGRRHWA